MFRKSCFIKYISTVFTKVNVKWVAICFERCHVNSQTFDKKIIDWLFFVKTSRSSSCTSQIRNLTNSFIVFYKNVHFLFYEIAIFFVKKSFI
jgi:hypothetical protein